MYDEIGQSFPTLIKCEYGLENCLDEIIALRPESLVIVDAVYSMDRSAGEIVLFEITDDLLPDHLLSTHSVSLGLVLKIFKNSGIKNIYVLGVVAKDIGLGLELSSEVLEAIETLKMIFKGVVSKCSSIPEIHE